MSSFKHLPLGQHAAPDSMDTIPMQDYATRDGRDYSYADLSTSTKHDTLNPTPPDRGVGARLRRIGGAIHHPAALLSEELARPLNPDPANMVGEQ